MSCDETNTGGVYVAVTRGDTLRLTVDLDASSGEVDVTDWLWLCQLRTAGGTLAGPMTVEVVEASKGVLELSLTAAQTAALAVADYDWDLQATDTDANVRTLVSGKLRVRADVSA